MFKSMCKGNELMLYRNMIGESQQRNMDNYDEQKRCLKKVALEIISDI